MEDVDVDVPEQEEELIEVIKKEDNAIVLYDKDGEKVLGRFPFGEGKKYKNEETAREAAKKREKEIQAFKHMKEESMPFSPDDAENHLGDVENSKRREWAQVANSAYRACVENDGDNDVCRKRAVTVANKQLKPEMKESQEEKATEQSVMIREGNEVRVLKATISTFVMEDGTEQIFVLDVKEKEGEGDDR
jgi:hypothetical protein